MTKDQAEEMVLDLLHSAVERERWSHKHGYEEEYHAQKQKVIDALCAAPSPFPTSLIVAFEDHYWDTFQRDRDLIMKHVRAVLREYEINAAIARAHLPKVGDAQ